MSHPRQKLFFALSAVAGLTVESLAANPLVPGVSVISVGPAKGHSAWDSVNDQSVPVWVDAVTLQTVAAAAALYAGGLRVNAGHFSEITEAAGRLVNFITDGPKLRADLSLFRTYSQFAHLCELIVTIPDTFGLSIDFEGEAEIKDGKALARCTEIFSCDLVPAPAANEGGLFSRGLSPELVARARRLFDSAPPAIMADPVTPPPAAPPASATPPPATPPAVPAAPDAKAITDAVTTALAPMLETALNPVKTELAGIAARLTTVEASIAADADDAAAVEASPAPPAMKRHRKELVALKAIVATLQLQSGELGTKLARRLGIEFAARAGANPIETPAAGGEGTETRKAFQIPSSERNARMLEERGIKRV